MNKKAFTLTELLVSIAIIVLIAAIVVPTSARARKQARSTICQGRLRQWGFLLDASASETDGVLPLGSWFAWCVDFKRYSRDWELLLCPMATKSARLPTDEWEDTRWDPFDAWGYLVRGEPMVGSFGKNAFAYPSAPEPYFWTSVNVKAADNIPVMLDCLFPITGGTNFSKPPAYEEQPRYMQCSISDSCINRHNGSVNCVFMDNSVRKVGLKGLWRLKWEPYFDTCGYLEYWKKKGTPTDWPEWMQKFPDY